MAPPARYWPKGIPRSLNVPERSVAENLAASAARVPNKPALIYHGATVTFAVLAAEVDRMAGWLVHGAGITKGDRVLLYMQNSPQFVIAFYAILRADAVVVPVNPMNRTAELEHLATDTGARIAFAGQELLPHAAPLLGGPLTRIVAATYADMADPDCDIPLPEGLRDHAPADYGIAGVVRWADAMAAGHAPGPLKAGPDDLAVIPYTSGTTGKQKGCMHTHRTTMWTLVGSLAWNPQGMGKPSLATLPFYHVTGMQNSMNGPIFYGETTVIMSRWDRAVAAELIRRHRVGRWRSISTMAIDLVNDPDVDRYDLSSLETIGGGGAAMPEPIARRLKELTGLDYIEGYGMSETMAGTHINPIDRPKRACLGVPVFDVDSRVVDPETLKELLVGEPGEILIHAPQNFIGYWNAPEATREAMVELDGKTFVRTGDIGYVDAEGFFFITDRLKRMVNCAGLKVWPTEVEAAIHDHPAVAEVCVVGRPDPRRGESVVAHVVPRAPLEPAELIRWCRDRMAAYKCPRDVVLTDALPRLPSGKIDWRTVQDRDGMADDEGPERG